MKFSTSNVNRHFWPILVYPTLCKYSSMLLWKSQQKSIKRNHNFFQVNYLMATSELDFCKFLSVESSCESVWFIRLYIADILCIYSHINLIKRKIFDVAAIFSTLQRPPHLVKIFNLFSTLQQIVAMLNMYHNFINIGHPVKLKLSRNLVTT